MNHVDKLRIAYQAWHDSRGTDAAAWLDLLAPDVVLRSLAGDATDLGATRRGRDEVERYFGEIAQHFEMAHFTAEEFIAEGDRVVVLGQCAATFRPTGKLIQSPVAHVWRFRDGFAVDIFKFYDTAGALAAIRRD